MSEEKAGDLLTDPLMVPLTDAQKLDFARALHVGWQKYVRLLGEPPHGTLPQIRALLELTHFESVLIGVRNKAISQWYAEGQR